MARSGRRAVARPNRSIPLIPGRRWSDTTASTTLVSTRSNAASPLAASTAWQPARSSTRPRRARTDESSSHTRTTGAAVPPSAPPAAAGRPSVAAAAIRVERLVAVGQGKVDHRPAPGVRDDLQPQDPGRAHRVIGDRRARDPQAPPGVGPTQGLDRLDQRRRERLAHHRWVAVGIGHVGGDVDLDVDTGQRIGGELEHRLHQGLHRDRPIRQRAGAGQLQQRRHHPVGAVGLVPQQPRIGPQVGGDALVRGEDRGEGEDRAERVGDVVRDAVGEEPERVHPARQGERRGRGRVVRDGSVVGRGHVG